ncbi:hypothetical protein TNCV_3261801 [Trichonephila clavipes]|nr:hypothetical protein TNCV_3261801 [Trichonephila clavipes]
MTTREPTEEPFEPIYPRKGEVHHYYTFVKDVPKKKEERKFSLRLGGDILNDIFKRYLSVEAYRKEILFGVEGVDNSSLFHVDENDSYGLNKVLIEGILQNSFNSEYLVVEDDVLMREIGRALKELHDDTEIEDGPFLIEEMEKFEIAKEQSRNRLKESRNQMQ